MARAILVVLLVGATVGTGRVTRFAHAAQPAELAPRDSQGSAGIPPLRFRRIYVPAERVQDWPRGTARYVPVEGEEFERLLKAAQEQGAEGPSPASLFRAEYTAQLDGSENLQGSFAWEIERSGNASAPIALTPLSLALGKSRWSDSPRPVELGLDPNGVAVLIADRSGTVTGTWSLRGRRDSEGQLAFRFELPRAAGTTLLLTVPPGVEPTATAGLASLVEEQADRHVYRILLGGASEMTLRMPSAPTPTTDQPTVLLRESSVYNLSARGVDLATVWRLDVHSSLVRKIVLSLDPGLQLVSARLGETELPFSPVPDTTAVGTQLSLELPDALAGSDRPLRLSAIGPLPADPNWALPRIRASDFTWQEGTCTLLVHEPLAVSSLRTRDCRQTKYSVLPEPNRGESFEIQLFSNDSAVELDLARAYAVAQLSTGLNVELGTDAAQAELVAIPRVAHGHRSSFVGDIGADWIIDDVETVPRDALGSWRVDTADASPQLTLKLARPLSSESTIKLVVRGHRPAAADATGQWRAGDLDPLNFRDAVEERLLTVRPAPALALELTDAERLARVDNESVNPAAMNLFLEPPLQPIYRFDPATSRFLATVHDEQPTFAAKIVGTVTVDHLSIAESYSIRCQPDDKAVSRLVIHFSDPRPDPPRFSLVGSGETAIVARRLSDAEQATAKFATAAEAWQLVLATPQAGPFELSVERLTSHAEQTSLSLVGLPGAGPQQAQLAIEASADVGISIRESGVNVIPSGDDPVTPTTRVTIQYSPENTAAKVVIARERHPLVPKSAAVVLHRRVESQYDVAGQAWHLATFQLRSAGQDRIELRVPDECTTTRLWLNGRPLPRPMDTSSTIRLPVDDPSSTLVVEYHTDEPSLSNGGTLWAPLANIDLPILSSQWLLTVPPGFELARVIGGLAEPAVRGFSWSERLFGPLGRGPSAVAFDPFSARGWSYLAGRFSWAERSAAIDFASHFTELSRGPDDASGVADWGKLLIAADRMARDSSIRLSVDAVALGNLRIGPRTPIAQSPPRSPERAQLGPFARAGVALLYTPDAVLLTSRLSATIHRDQIRWIEPGQLGILLPGLLRDSLASNSGDDASYLSAATWAEHGLDPAPLDADLPTFEDGGGAALPYLIQIDGLSQPVVWLLRRSSWATWRSASCMLAWAMCACFVRRQKTLVVALLIALALALIVPQSLIPWTTGILWGIALALAWQWLAPRVRPVPRAVTHSTSSSVRQVISAVPVIIAILSASGIVQMASWAVAQQSAKPVTRDDAGDRVHRVFIPVDEKEQPTNDKYQVPELLFDELQRRVADASGTTAGCLVRAARYQLSVSRDAMNDALVPNDVRAQYDVLVLRPDMVLRLPVIGVRSGPVALRDGREMDLEWDTDEDGFSCRFVEPGLYQLDLSLRNQRVEATANSFDIEIPAVPQASVTVQFPANAPTIEVPSAYGATTFSADGRTLSVQLGPADRLSLRWARARQSRSPQIAGDVDIWQWLQVQPASVVLHARLDIKALKTPLSELWLSIDPRLRALPVVDRSGTVASVQPIVGDAQTVRVELARPVSDHVTIPVSFLLVGSSGIGAISLPRIEPPALRVGRRVVAVSVEPALQFELPPIEPGTVMTVTDFLTHWGGAPAPPQAVVQLASAQPWTIATRPRELVTAARQRLGLSIGEGRAAARFEATIAPAEGQAPAAGYVLQHQVRAPADLEIEKISLVQDGIDRVSRWTRDESGLISLFLMGPVTGRQQLFIDGWLPTPPQGDWSLPRFDVESATRRDTTITLARQPAVQIALTDQHGLAEADRSRPAEDVTLPGRIVAALVATQSDYGATLHITANAPHVRASMVATVQKSTIGPLGQIDYRTTVEDGVLDAIAIELPAGWLGPFEIAPPSPLETITTAGDMRRLIVRPKAAVEGDFHFTLRGPIDFVATEPIVPPTAIVAGGEQCATFFVLPTGWGNERLRWNTRGMQPDQLPDGIMMSDTPASATHVYHVNGADAAAWPMILPSDSASLASTAEVHWLFSSIGENRGIAAFYIGNTERHAYQLLVPDSLRVLELRVNGRPRTPSPDGKGWKIDLTPQDDRQTIEVVFETRAALEATKRDVELTAPSLDGVDFDQARWIVYSPALTDPPKLIAAGDLPPLIMANHDTEPALNKQAQAAFGMFPAQEFVFAGTAPTVMLRFPSQSASPVALRLLAASMVAIGALGFSRRTSATISSPSPWRWALLGVVVGLLALAWLEPAWPGVVILLASMGIVVWPRLRDVGVGNPQDASGPPAA